jgi:threonine dehydrogenase-like Zn-dependent dehydrogenase
VEIREESLGEPGPGLLLIQTRASAISPGTECLILRGEASPISGTDVLDSTLDALPGKFEFPFKYGYACAGVVKQAPEGLKPWEGLTVVCLNPHETYFYARPDQLITIPQEIAPEKACLLPFMETAVNLVLDGAPLLGEEVAIFGQGLIGLFVTSILSGFPLARLFTIEPVPRRRAESLRAGATHSVHPSECGINSADLAYELSGRPETLAQAVASTRFSGRIVIGSWYGTRDGNSGLGGEFHRKRIQIISSQVSTLAPALTGRWSARRRIDEAWKRLDAVDTNRLITHQFPFREAQQAYGVLDNPGEAIGIVLNY